ncbi:ovalbumin-related protein X [Microplitis demolitor]|uniref:ovalbumin-related protein X n=1 Tax=Microplitis demolitor TaxID=69319 RepID=UPI0004CD5784|nr:ovalbumin-related protein X [Microplitis demolitor]
MAEERSENNKNLCAVLSGINKFSIDFYKTISDYEKDNLIYSPLSIGIVLSMAAFGARDITEQEIKSGLHLHQDNEINKNGFQSLVDYFNKIEKVKFKLAQTIFTIDGFEIKHEFKNIIKNIFGSSTKSINFKHSAEACKIINKWYAKKTDDCIEEIVESHDLDNAIMVLASVVYFSGPWLFKFDSENTRPRPFHIDGETTINVDAMYQLNSFNYGPLPDIDAVYIELPYEKTNRDDATSMFIILPNEISDLSRVRESLAEINFKSLENNQIKTEIYLHMPKFKVQSTLKLEPFLEKMGMTNMFRDNANFSGITDRLPLKISKVIHNALIGVNEHGTEAATTAATNVLFESSRSWHSTPITVDINRPFVFVIYHSATNSILLQGHIKSPSN